MQVSPTELVHSSFLGSKYESRIISVFGFSITNPKCRELLFLGLRTIGLAESVVACLKIIYRSILSTSVVAISFLLDQDLYGHHAPKWLELFWCGFQILECQRSPSHILTRLLQSFRNLKRCSIYFRAFVSSSYRLFHRRLSSIFGLFNIIVVVGDAWISVCKARSWQIRKRCPVVNKKNNRNYFYVGLRKRCILVMTCWCFASLTAEINALMMTIGKAFRGTR